MNFYWTSLLLGIGLAMDASAVSMANGLKEPKMKIGKIVLIAAMFGLFQAIMPIIGYLIGHAVLSTIEPFIPWIALVILGFLGGKMVFEGIRNKKEEEDEGHTLTFWGLLVQAIATSIDALSTGFTFADYDLSQALIAASLIMAVTFVISFVSVFIGKKFGDKLGRKAVILGGLILIGIGLEIFLTGIL